MANQGKILIDNLSGGTAVNEIVGPFSIPSMGGTVRLAFLGTWTTGPSIEIQQMVNSTWMPLWVGTAKETAITGDSQHTHNLSGNMIRYVVTVPASGEIKIDYSITY